MPKLSSSFLVSVDKCLMLIVCKSIIHKFLEHYAWHFTLILHAALSLTISSMLEIQPGLEELALQIYGMYKSNHLIS